VESFLKIIIKNALPYQIILITILLFYIYIQVTQIAILVIIMLFKLFHLFQEVLLNLLL